MSFDWIDEFLDLTDTVRSPPEFRLWAGLTVLAAVLERRVWTETDNGRLCPNIFTILSGSPASGKGLALGEARNMLRSLSGKDEVYLGPDNPSSASFLDEFARAEKIAKNGMGVPTYSPVTVLGRELASFMTKYDTTFAANLSDIYDNPPTFSSPRRQSKSLILQAPSLNFAIAATPDTLLDAIPETAWGQGLTSRIVFVYGIAPKKYRDPFKKRKDLDLARLTGPLREYFNELHGEFIWDADAMDALRFWINELGCEPVPDYGRLVNYVGRRTEHVQKLAMLSAVSAGNGIFVTLPDLERAQRWLFTTEKTMPDIFRAMNQKSDAQLLNDMHYWMHTTHGSRKPDQQKKGITERELYAWLEERVPHEKIPTMIKTMESSGRMRKGVNSNWFPSALDFRN
jgi:hypothetical protein